jgi:hypothetical protein
VEGEKAFKSRNNELREYSILLIYLTMLSVACIICIVSSGYDVLYTVM